MAVQVTEEQKNILKHLEELEKNLQYQSISELYLSSSNSNV
jgi:hypothetical protein